jgi:hypothetical protein
MSTVAAVYTIEPFLRTPTDIVNELRPARDATEARRPRPENKRVWASIEKEPAEVVDEMFREAIGRDRLALSPRVFAKAFHLHALAPTATAVALHAHGPRSLHARWHSMIVPRSVPVRV